MLWVLGFSINILTLLALVLAIGLVVDDAIVVLENIHRRMEQYGETRLVAAFRGTRQVGFAVVATSVVLIAVFVPIAFLQGDVGPAVLRVRAHHGRGGGLLHCRRAVALAHAGLQGAAPGAPPGAPESGASTGSSHGCGGATARPCASSCASAGSCF